MKERTSAKATELYSVIMTFIAAKTRVEVADLEADPDLTFREDVTRPDRRRVLRDIVADVNRAGEAMAAGHQAEARELAVEIATDYREYFHDDAVKSDREKRTETSRMEPRELADRITRKF